MNALKSLLAALVEHYTSEVHFAPEFERLRPRGEDIHSATSADSINTAALTLALRRQGWKGTVKS